MRLTGKPSGDGECFCFEVTEEEFRRVMGEEAYQEELADKQYWRTESEQEGFDVVPHSEKWLIYPNDLLRCLFGEYQDLDKVTIEITRVD